MNLIELTRVLAALVVLTVVCGCGSQTYEQRLDESRKYFTYREKVDSALEKRWWQSGNFGLRFRPPKGFVEIPAPAEEEADLRQPTFLPRALPGLLGAWETTVPVQIEEEPDVSELQAWIFLCTNHKDHLDKFDDPLIEPLKFNTRIIDNIAFNLRYQPPTETEPWPFEEERVPVGTPYVPRKNYVATSLRPLEDRVNIDGSGEVNMNFMLNQYEQGPIQMMLIAAYPSAIDPRYDMHGKIKIAMETLQMTDEIPRPAKAGGAQNTAGGF